MSPNRLPGEAAAAALDFEPVPLRYRRDGWTPARQAAFVAALRRTRCIRAACREVGVSPAAAYKLYRHPAAASLRRAWHAALAGPGRAWSPSTSAKPSTSAPARPIRAPFVAVAFWPVPKRAAPEPSCISSTSSTSSTSAETNGKCRTRPIDQLPARRELPAFAEASAGKPEAAARSLSAEAPEERRRTRPDRPAYSFEAFLRAARAARRVPPK